MSKRSFVLRALNILGLEEMIKLSDVLLVQHTALKKAAGEELIVWDSAPITPHTARPQEEGAKVINFPNRTILEPQATEEIKGEADKTEIIGTDLMLWQREISRTSGKSVQKVDAFKGYKKSTEMYVVKEASTDGKDKIRFASTNGVLVNKKQA